MISSAASSAPRHESRCWGVLSTPVTPAAVTTDPGAPPRMEAYE